MPPAATTPSDRERPVEHSHKVGVRYTEVVKQVLAARQVVGEHSQPLRGPDEAQPLVKPHRCHPALRREPGRRELPRDRKSAPSFVRLALPSMSVNTASPYSVLRVAIEHAAPHPLAAPAALPQADLHAAPDLTDAGRRAARVPVLRCRPRAALPRIPAHAPDRRDHRAPAWAWRPRRVHRRAPWYAATSSRCSWHPDRCTARGESHGDAGSRR